MKKLNSSVVIYGILYLKYRVSLRLQESNPAFCSFLQQVWGRARNISKDKTCFWFSFYNKFQTLAHHFEVVIITYYTWFTVILVITSRPVSCLTASQHLHFSNGCSTYHSESPALNNGTSISLWTPCCHLFERDLLSDEIVMCDSPNPKVIMIIQSITMISQKYSFTRWPFVCSYYY